MTPSGVASIEALGLRGTLFLAALLAAQLRRIPVAPTRRSTLLVLDALRDLALIQVPWPADRWQIRPDAEVTPIEDLQWAFAWSTHERRHLLPVLEDQLGDMAHDVELADAKLELWDELALCAYSQAFDHAPPERLTNTGSYVDQIRQALNHGQSGRRQTGWTATPNELGNVAGLPGK